MEGILEAMKGNALEGVEVLQLLKSLCISARTQESKGHLEISDIRPQPYFLHVLHLSKCENNFTRHSREEGVWNLREVIGDEIMM